jgi:ferric-dicitrate binding protein FerR (iron transport regulator)
MKNNIDMQHISDLLYKYATGSLSESEKTELEAWVGARPERRIFLERLSSPQWLETDYRRQKGIDVEKAISEMKTRISLSDNSEQIDMQVANGKEQKTGEILGNRPSLFSVFSSQLWKVAAVLVLLIVGGTFWYREHTRVTPPTISEEVQTAMQLSRKSGRAAAKVEAVNNQQSSPVTQEVRQLYHVDEQFAEQLAEAKRITTYQDKEYWVTLEDGTLVHLNYNSRLIYPEKFGDRRDVILDGEAYFMVAKDKSRQFVVHTPQGDVKVYGTEFWVNTRADAQASQPLTVSYQLALVSGSISFTPTNGKEAMLKPGQELSIVNSQLSITDVDTAPYVAWNTGNFVFDDCPLEQLTDVLARWYGMKVRFYSDSSRHILFTGILSRYADVMTSLESISAVANVEITIEGNTIIVK